jgi:hypothetical protein
MMSNPFTEVHRIGTARRFRSIALCAALIAAACAALAQNEPPPPALSAPISVYNNWSSYDELSDNIPLTGTLAMRELDELLRLKRAGVRFDYYMMDAFWFAPDGAYRTWRKPNWPNGPDAWIQKCRRNGVLPGLWFSTNTLVKIQAAPAWKDSLNADGGAMSFFEGGFLPDFMNALQFWYDHGIRMFKFDFVDMTAATAADAATMSKAEIKERNATAFRECAARLSAEKIPMPSFSHSTASAALSTTIRTRHCPSATPPTCAGLKPFRWSTPATRVPPMCPKPISGAQWTSTATTWCAASSSWAFLSSASTQQDSWPARQAPSITAPCTRGKVLSC